MGELTLEKVKAAAEFGPELCYPVAKLIDAFEGYLPAQDVLILASEFISPGSYLAPDSELKTYYYQTLIKFKKLLSDFVKPKHLNYYFDPSITFFKSKLESRSAIRINCLGEKPELAAQAVMRPLQRKDVDSEAIKRYLKGEFGVDVEAELKSWLAHRVFFADISGGNDLVIVIVENHASYEGAYNQLALLDVLVENRDGFEMRIALESIPSGFEKRLNHFKTSSGISGSADKMRELRGRGASAKRLLQEILSDRKYVQDYCKLIIQENPGFTRELCMSNAIIQSVRDLALFSVLGTKPELYWPLENEEERKEGLAYLFGLNQSEKSMESCELCFNSLMAVSIKRNKTMARNLDAKLREGRTSDKPRIIILATGAAHSLDIIRELQIKNQASILGLMSPNFAEIFKYLPKPKN